MSGSKNNIKNRGVNTHNPDRTLVITYDAAGHQHRTMQVVPGIMERLSKTPSAPNGRRLSGKSK